MTTLTVQAQTPSGIRPNLPESRLESCVASTARLAGAVALSALATLFSLVLLPWQLALPISLGVAVILLVSEIPPHSYSERVYLTRSPPPYPLDPMPILLPPIPWYRRMVHWIPFSRREFIPVADPRPREIVGDAYRYRSHIVALPSISSPQIQYAPPRPDFRDRTPVGHREGPAVRARDIPRGTISAVNPSAAEELRRASAERGGAQFVAAPPQWTPLARASASSAPRASFSRSAGIREPVGHR